MDKVKKIITDGIWNSNPVLVQAIGLCPTLAVTSSVQNALYMGMATTFVLISSNIIISLIKKTVPANIRIPVFISVIATFVTIVQLYISAFMPALNKSLGIFIPLIVVNCMILGRAEAFASKNNTFYSIIDGLFMGIGFTIALILMATIREVLGANKFLGFLVFPASFKPAAAMILPVGGFLAIAILMMGMNYINLKKEKRE